MLTISLAGCSTFEGYPDSVSSSGILLEQPDKYLSDQLDDYERAGEDQRWYIRNNLVRRRMIIIDSAYEQFERDLYVQNLRGGVYTDWSTNLLTTMGPVTDHIPTRNLLSGMAAILSNGKAVYEANVLTKSTMSALISEMRAARTKTRDQIRQKSGLPPSQYDLYDALQDLDSYTAAGSLPSAIASLTATAAKNEQAAEKSSHDAQTAREMTASPASGLGAGPVPVDGGYGNSTGLDEETLQPAPAAVAGAERPLPTPVVPVDRENRAVAGDMDHATNIGGGNNTPSDTDISSVPRVAEVIRAWVVKSPQNEATLQAWLREKPAKRPQSIEKLLTEQRYDDLRYEVHDKFVH